MRTKTLSAEKIANTIALEARFAQVSACTIEGTAIINAQIEAGLSRTAQQWLDNIDDLTLDDIRAAATDVIRNSIAARLIIEGCKVAITGPPNSGKSTLLNCLCGRQKAIVTDIKGTTRDWLSARCTIGPLSVELIDTAGLDVSTGSDSNDELDIVAQQRTLEILKSADMVLLVLDASEPLDSLDPAMMERISGKRLLTILNKSDLPAKLDPDNLPEILYERISLSAKLATGIEQLIAKIPQICGTTDFDVFSAICFTARQYALLKQLQQTQSKRDAASAITELLNGSLDV